MYRVIKAVHFDTDGGGAGLMTISQRTGLDLEIVQACCEAMQESGALTVADVVGQDYRVWFPAVLP